MGGKEEFEEESQSQIKLRRVRRNLQGIDITLEGLPQELEPTYKCIVAPKLLCVSGHKH
jgi:hypothetical protein